MRILRPRKIYGGIGRCIYCGVADGPLGDEHIIPRSLGGALVLKDASCRDCEAKINSFEGYCTSHMMGAFRRRSGIPFRARDMRRWPEKIEFQVLHEGDTTEPKMIPWQDVPRALYLPVLPPADTVLGGRSPHIPWMWIISNDADRERARKEHGGIGYTLGHYDVPKFCRFLAKIAHSFIVAEMKRTFYDSYRPLLPDFIRFGSGDPRTYVGGEMIIPPDDPNMYRVGLYPQDAGGHSYICAYVRIFPFAKTPLHHVVVGQRL
jgi:hypothetical protein